MHNILSVQCLMLVVQPCTDVGVEVWTDYDRDDDPDLEHSLPADGIDTQNAHWL